MASSMVIQRYAQALFQESVASTSILNDVKLIQSTIDSSKDLERLLKSPVVSRHKKSVILESLFKENVDVTTLRFIQMLVQRGRESLLTEILTSFQDLSDEDQGVVSVKARVLSKLSDDELRRIENVLSDKLKCRIRLHAIIDSSLMGGIILEIGDRVYDGSVRHQLSLLKSRLLTQN